MSDFAELALEGAIPLIDKSDLLYEKGKDAVKSIPFVGKRNDRSETNRHERRDDGRDGNDYEYNSPRRTRTESQADRYDRRAKDDYAYDSPRRSNTDRQPTRYIGYYAQDPEYDSLSRQPASSGYPPNSRGYRDGPSRTNETYRSYRSKGYYEDPSDSGSAVAPRRPGIPRRRSSFDTAELTRKSYRPGGGYQNESDDSEHNRSRRNPTNGTVATRDTRKNSKSSEDGDSSSGESSILSEKEEERKARKMRRREFITAGLAVVTTVHAASGLYSSLEERNERRAKVKKGSLSAKDAKMETSKNRLRDLAAIGVAALSIKEAYSEWEGARSKHVERVEFKEGKKERDEKRRERARRERRNSSPGRRDEGRYEF